MATPSDITNHDFSALNRHVDQLVARNNVLTWRQRAGVFTTFAKYGAIFLLAVGVAALLVLWGISLLKAKPKPEVIEKQVVVEKPVTLQPNIYVNTETGDQAEMRRLVESGEKRIETYKREDEVRSPNSSGIGVPTYSHVIFREFAFGREGMGEVIIGIARERADQSQPSSQWCYVEKPQFGGASKKFSLARKQGASVSNTPINVRVAREVGVSQNTLQAAQRLCRFD